MTLVADCEKVASRFGACFVAKLVRHLWLKAVFNQSAAKHIDVARFAMQFHADVVDFGEERVVSQKNIEFSTFDVTFQKVDSIHAIALQNLIHCHFIVAGL